MTKTIQVSEEAYECLSNRKREDETYSDVVLRLTEERSLLELVGLFTDKQAEAVADAIDERRNRQRSDESPQ